MTDPVWAAMVEPVSGSVLEQTRAFCHELEQVLAAMPSVHTLPPEQTRRARREGRGIFPAPVFSPEAEMRHIRGPAGELTLRVIPPRGQPQGAFLHIHGGGWTLGGCDMQDLHLRRLAGDTGLTVLSVGYRLAPEHPYPAAPDDCEAAARWLCERREELGLGADAPLAIGGDSAGAHLAATTLLRLRRRPPQGRSYQAALLQYGAFDLSQTPSQRLWGERNLVLSTPIISWFGDQFLPDHDLEGRRNPEISPLYAELHELPPALFTVGTQDALLDDTLFMERRWRAAGNVAELRLWPEAPHGFLSLPMAMAELAMDAEHEFLRRTLEVCGG